MKNCKQITPSLHDFFQDFFFVHCKIGVLIFLFLKVRREKKNSMKHLFIKSQCSYFVMLVSISDQIYVKSCLFVLS